MIKKQELTLEEKEEKVRDFRPRDDAFFETLADDRAFCQEILRVILSDKKLVVEQGGLDAVCDVMERYEEIAAEKAEEKANIKAVKNMIKVFQATKQQILQIYSETEYEQAVKELEEEEAE